RFRSYNDRGKIQEDLKTGKIIGYYVISPDYLETGIVRFVVPLSIVNIPGQPPLAEWLLPEAIGDRVPPDVLPRIIKPVEVKTCMLGETGDEIDIEKAFSAKIVLLPIGLALLLFIAIITTSGYILRGLDEEREGRLMEVMLSAVDPHELLYGKVIAGGCLGFTQLGVWMLFLLPKILPKFYIIPYHYKDFFVLSILFVLGYFLMAGFFAGIAAISSSRGSQQLSLPVIALFIAPMLFVQILMENPSGKLAVFFTFFPISAPFTIMLRWTLQAISSTEFAMAIILLGFFALLSFKLSSGLFQAKLLLYGKKLSLPQVLELLRKK
ncbi:MAG: ABC transporter permease, partial [Candidatus Eremiobacteraeota bacterium]|nr:ABC transporter permease [Candidatus Eremiobacteraeota bacterium]